MWPMFGVGAGYHPGGSSCILQQAYAVRLYRLVKKSVPRGGLFGMILLISSRLPIDFSVYLELSRVYLKDPFGIPGRARPRVPVGIPGVSSSNFLDISRVYHFVICVVTSLFRRASCFIKWCFLCVQGGYTSLGLGFRARFGIPVCPGGFGYG